MKNLEQDGKIRLQSLGHQTKRQLQKQGKSEPEIQDWYQVNARTKIGIPAKLSDKEIQAWKIRMDIKYNGYDKRNEKARLTGAAKKVKDQL